MASPLSVACCALLALAFFGAVGLPVSRRLFQDRRFALALSPTLGFALFSAAALPISCVIGFDGPRVAALAIAALGASFALHRRSPPAADALPAEGVAPVAYGLAAALAVAVAAALLPWTTSDGVLLAGPVFDHSKVAIVDEIVRNGVPAQNPFYGEAGAPSGLAYYYLWHFTAAMLALMPGVSGWEADVGLTWFTTFSMLAMMMALAVRISSRTSAAYWTLALSLTASARWLFDGVFGQAGMKAWLSAQPVANVIPQIVWAPQHGASAACVLLSALLIDRLSRSGDWLTALCLGLTTAAGFASSVWVGGFAFVPIACFVGLMALVTAREGRGRFLRLLILAAAIAVVAASPILLEQIHAATVRTEGVPVSFRPYEVLGAGFPEWARRPLDLVAYWTIQLPYDLPAIYPAGALFLAAAALRRSDGEEDCRLARLCGLVALASFGVAGLLASTLLNNDLGWRANLPGLLVLTAYAAAGLSRWTFRARPMAAVAQAALLALGIGGGVAFARHWMTPFPSTSAAEFARSPDLWRAVRERSGPKDRIAANPMLFAGVTPWPINISWALLSDRRSCYAAWEFTRALAPISLEAANAMQRQFRDVFEGAAPAEETFRLLKAHDCRLVVITASDGAWASDPFARDDRYELAEERSDRWRLYVIPDAPRDRR